MYNKVELCGMNTAKLPVLTEAEKRELPGLTIRADSHIIKLQKALAL